MPYGYRGLKIFTSLSLRFQDFQRMYSIEAMDMSDGVAWSSEDPKKLA